MVIFRLQCELNTATTIAIHSDQTMTDEWRENKAQNNRLPHTYAC